MGTFVSENMVVIIELSDCNSSFLNSPVNRSCSRYFPGYILLSESNA